MLFLSSSVPPPTHLRPHPTSLLALSSLPLQFTLRALSCSVSLPVPPETSPTLSASLSLLTPSHVFLSASHQWFPRADSSFFSGEISQRSSTKALNPPWLCLCFPITSLQDPPHTERTHTHTQTHTPTQSTVRRGYKHRDNTHTHTHKLSVCVHV